MLRRPSRWFRNFFRNRLVRWLIGLGVTGLVVAAGFLPYPYHTGGQFRLMPARRLDVRAEVEGLVEKVFVQEGDWVKEKARVAQLVKRVHEKNLKASEAQLKERQAQLRLLKAGPKLEEVAAAEQAVQTARTKVEYSGPRARRFEGLYKEKLVSDQDLETARRQRDVDLQELRQAQANLVLTKSGTRRESIQAMESEIDSLQAMVTNYRTDVERTVIHSPIEGRITTPRVNELVGSYLKPGQHDLVVQIEDARSIRAEVEVPEEDSAGIRIGSQVELAAWAYSDKTFLGTVVSIAPVATGSTPLQYDVTSDGESRSTVPVTMSDSTWKVVRVITDIPNADGILKSEMTGYAKIAVEQRSVWDVLLRPIIRWVRVEVWYWIP